MGQVISRVAPSTRCTVGRVCWRSTMSARSTRPKRRAPIRAARSRPRPRPPRRVRRRPNPKRDDEHRIAQIRPSHRSPAHHHLSGCCRSPRREPAGPIDSRFHAACASSPSRSRARRTTQQLAVARTAEELGFDAFFRSDHYLRMGDGDPGPGPTDAWVTLAGLARETTTIRLGTLVHLEHVPAARSAGDRRRRRSTR